jgi:branched-chain amino acid transport system ATP-binding protein
MLEVQGLASGYGALVVVRDVDLSLHAGGRLALVGPNGAGKTTLLETIAGLVPVANGRLLLDGADVSRLRPEVRMRRGLSLVTERRNLFPDLTAMENVRLGRCAAPRAARWAAEEVRRATERVFDLFPPLRQIAQRQVRVLSGGEQQMVAVGRALMGQPRILMLDEPSQGLAPRIVEAMYEAIDAIAHDTAILLVEQDLGLARSVARDVHLMLDGRLRPLSAAELQSDTLVVDELFGARE